MGGGFHTFELVRWIAGDGEADGLGAGVAVLPAMLQGKSDFELALALFALIPHPTWKIQVMLNRMHAANCNVRLIFLML